MKTNSIKVIHISAVLLIAVSLKAFYSSSNVNELRWILAPTTFLVELVTGQSFTFESYSGYMNDERSFVIAGSCSGVNFLITAFLVLTLGTLLRGQTQRVRWTFIVYAAAAAFLTTIVANTVRICIALQMRQTDPDLLWLNPDQLHRFEGIVIYFGFLLLLFVASEKLRAENGSGNRVLGSRFRGLLLPLLIYYATTLGIPLVNAVYRGTSLDAGLREHLFFVLLIPLAIAGIFAAIRSAVNRGESSLGRLA